MKVYKIVIFLWKCANKPFTHHTPPQTLGHFQKVVRGIQKNHVKYFAAGIHQIMKMKDLYRMLRVDVNLYNIFFSQFFEWCVGVAQNIIPGALFATVKGLLGEGLGLYLLSWQIFFLTLKNRPLIYFLGSIRTKITMWWIGME